jgi:hypothetical protein
MAGIVLALALRRLGQKRRVDRDVPENVSVPVGENDLVIERCGCETAVDGSPPHVLSSVLAILKLMDRSCTDQNPSELAASP